jgi:hypothetical protein
LTFVLDIVDAIENLTSDWNDDPPPLVRIKPARFLIAKVPRGRTTLTY